MEISAREHILDKEGFTRDELETWLFFDSRGLLYDDHQSAMHRILYPVYGMRPRRREQASNLSSKTKVASCSCSSGSTACRNSPFSILTLTFHVHVFSDRSASHGPRLVPQPSPTFVTRSRLVSGRGRQTTAAREAQRALGAFEPAPLSGQVDDLQ